MSVQKITVLSKSEESRFARTELMGWWKQNIVSEGSILVVGAGAIGNETLKNLALLGVGRIFICDMDTISVSNLSRTVLFREDDIEKNKAEIAAERTKQMSNNPDCKIDYFVGDIIHGLGHGVFRRFDIVLGCLDNVFTRINVNRRCNMFKKPYMDAAISELALMLNVHHYPNSSCLECGMNPKDVENERQIRYACGHFKERAIQEGHAATVLISTAIVSALQVQEAIKALHLLKDYSIASDISENFEVSSENNGTKDESSSNSLRTGSESKIVINSVAEPVPESIYGKRYDYQGLNHMFEKTSVKTKENCLSEHFTIDDEIIETSLSSKTPLGEALKTLHTLFDYECVIDIYPFTAFITKGNCIECRKELIMNKPMHDIFRDEFYCFDCKVSEGKKHPADYTAIDMFHAEMEEEYLLDYPLEKIGIPPLHIITVRKKDNDSVMKFVELTADLEIVLPNTFGG